MWRQANVNSNSAGGHTETHTQKHTHTHVHIYSYACMYVYDNNTISTLKCDNNNNNNNNNCAWATTTTTKLNSKQTNKQPEYKGGDQQQTVWICAKKGIRKNSLFSLATNCNLLRPNEHMCPSVRVCVCVVSACVFATYSGAAAASAHVFDMSKMFTKPFDKAINERMNEWTHIHTYHTHLNLHVSRAVCAGQVCAQHFANENHSCPSSCSHISARSALNNASTSLCVWVIMPSLVGHYWVTRSLSCWYCQQL